MRTLSHAEVRDFYDRFGAKQDAQRFYEDPALRDLVAHAAFGRARRVVEFGCGTGRFAARLLERELSPQATYLGVDVSDTMVALASSRLARFRERAEVRRSDGTVALPVADGACDRLVCTYVADLLPESGIERLLAEARRILVAEGRLCLVSLTHGAGVSRAVSGLWSAVHRLSPSLLGGCRPLELAPRLAGGEWRIDHRAVVRAWGISSEVLVATPAGSEPPDPEHG